MNAVNNDDANNQTNWPRRKEKKGKESKKNSANTRCLWKWRTRSRKRRQRQILGFFQLKSLDRAKNSICTSGVNNFYAQCFVEPSGYALGLQTAPRIKIMHFTPSMHNLHYLTSWIQRLLFDEPLKGSKSLKIVKLA
jgi:hypothetical protein